MVQTKGNVTPVMSCYSIIIYFKDKVGLDYVTNIIHNIN